MNEFILNLFKDLIHTVAPHYTPLFTNRQDFIEVQYKYNKNEWIFRPVRWKCWIIHKVVYGFHYPTLVLISKKKYYGIYHCFYIQTVDVSLHLDAFMEHFITKKVKCDLVSSVYSIKYSKVNLLWRKNLFQPQFFSPGSVLGWANDDPISEK